MNNPPQSCRLLTIPENKEMQIKLYKMRYSGGLVTKLLRSTSHYPASANHASPDDTKAVGRLKLQTIAEFSKGDRMLNKFMGRGRASLCHQLMGSNKGGPSAIIRFYNLIPHPNFHYDAFCVARKYSWAIEFPCQPSAMPSRASGISRENLPLSWLCMSEV